MTYLWTLDSWIRVETNITLILVNELIGYWKVNHTTMQEKKNIFAFAFFKLLIFLFWTHRSLDADDYRALHYKVAVTVGNIL